MHADAVERDVVLPRPGDPGALYGGVGVNQRAVHVEQHRRYVTESIVHEPAPSCLLAERVYARGVSPTTVGHARHWRTAADALALLRRRTSLTRRELGEVLGLGSGGLSDLALRLRSARLVVETTAARTGPGRPSMRLHAHPEAPVALVVDLRHGDWRLGTCALDGEVSVLTGGAHDGDPTSVLPMLRRQVRRAGRALGDRVIAAAIAVPGQVSGTDLLHASLLGWRDVDLAYVARGLAVPVVAGNDATMAAIAEARSHPGRPSVLLHLVVEVGLGGALIVDGQPMPAAHDLHGEFGHLPLGDPRQRCRCGALGCWTVAFDARDLASRIGDPQPTDPRGYLKNMLTRGSAPPAVMRARRDLATSLGRGLAGLVNAFDPSAVTLGALAGPVRDADPERFDAAYHDGLMALHRERPSLVSTSTAGTQAVLVGLGLTALDRALDAEQLARWAAR